MTRLSHFTGALPFLLACGVQHVPANAPGNIDVLEPPTHMEERTSERPSDPGEHVLALSYGIFAGLGGARPRNASGELAYALGTEVSLAMGDTERSHAGDVLIVPPLAYGINVGWTVLNGLGPKIGPLYAEAEVRSLFASLAVGWVYAPTTTHGPQATFAYGPFFVRGTHEFGLGQQLIAGILLKGWTHWTWSR
jgi:hypothetical protein